MIIPSHLKIGGMTYKIQICSESDLPDDAGALIETDKGLIKLLKGNEDFMRISLLHEVLHAANIEINEETIEFFAQAIYQIIVDNPEMFSNRKGR